MRGYAKISGKFWTGRTGRALRGQFEAQAIAVYLMAGPHANMIGLYRLPISYVVNDLGSSFEGASKALRSLSEDRFAEYDDASEFVFVRNGARTQVGDTLKAGDKRMTHVVTLLQEAVDASASNLVAQFLDEYALDYGIDRSPFEAPSKPLRSQRTESSNREQRAVKKRSPRALDAVSSEAADVAAYLLEAITSHKPDFTKSAAAWPKQADALLRRPGITPDRLKAAIDYAHRDPRGAFWRPNVLSVEKLGDKLDTLEGQMRGSNGKQGAKGWAAPAEPAEFAGGEVKL